MRCLIKRSNGGFILLGTALGIFLILSLFSIYLLRIVVNENVISGYNLLDIRTRNLSQTGLEHGLQLFKENGTPYVAPIERSFNNGNYTITFDPLLNQNGTSLPYSHFAMLKSAAMINDVVRNTRVFLSSYPDAFNLAFYGDSETFTQSGTTFSGDIYSNGNVSNLTISGTAYTTTGSGGTIHPGSPPSFPSHNASYFQTIISEVPVDSSGGEEEVIQDWTVEFTNCGQSGRYGPSQGQVNSTYTGTDLSGQVTVNNGIQSWTVPYTGAYTMQVYGARGGNGATYAVGNPGNGARMIGSFGLTEGDILHILVGQQGSYTSYSNNYGGGGGGGTYVAKGSNYSNANPLIIAGGGGGGGYNSGSYVHGQTGQDGSNGGNANSNNYSGPGTGGSSGYGASGSTYGGNAGGFYGNGSGSYNYYSELGIGFRNGGNGGNGQYGGKGGFGGGGGGYGGAGGGGGYSGGGGGAYSYGGAGGGGGSYNTGSNQDNVSGSNSGHGKVIISWTGTGGSSSDTGSGSGTTGGEDILQFNNCGATGKDGPSQSNCNSAYSGTSLDGAVTVYSGIQAWTVPADGTYTITAKGATGGIHSGSYNPGFPGDGATVVADIVLTQGDILYIVVGQKPTSTTSESHNGSAGGGGSWVYTGTSASNGIGGSGLIIVGGGGGGSGHGSSSSTGGNGKGGNNANSSNESANGESFGINARAGTGSCGNKGTGQGGRGTLTSNYGGSGGGAGWSSDGNNTETGSGGSGGDRFAGGISNDNSNMYGGFGGGGGSGGNGNSGGGGGGYTGGGAGNGYFSVSGVSGNSWGGGGGGGSYASSSTSNVTMTVGNSGINYSNTSNGYVTITPPSQTTEPEEPPVPSSYTETGTINLEGNTSTYGAAVTFDGATVNGPGKIISSNDIIFINSSNISGGIEIISGGEIVIQNSVLGTGVSSLTNSVILYGATGLEVGNGTVHGLSIIADGETSLSDANYYGALYNSATDCNMTNSQLTGSLVSSSGLNVLNCTITKGDLPPIYETVFGFEEMVIYGSYLEY